VRFNSGAFAEELVGIACRMYGAERSDHRYDLHNARTCIRSRWRSGNVCEMFATPTEWMHSDARGLWLHYFHLGHNRARDEDWWRLRAAEFLGATAPSEQELVGALQCIRDNATYQERFERQHAEWRTADYQTRHPDVVPVRLDALYGAAVMRPEGLLFRTGETGFSADAEQRAKDLFVLGAGRDALKAVQSTKGLPILGSEGGKYLMNAVMSFCITRIGDGAKMCAVVPGVPLFDHLLGVKLMIEHDEPKFIKTANVLGGRPGHFGTTPWVLP
jgi:hypothetical protein